MKKNNLKQVGFLALSVLSMNLHGDPVTHNTAATVAGATQAHPGQIRPGEETMEAREKKAFQFFMKLLTCPLEQVPAWKDFVNEIARLLEGNAKYAALRTSLLKVRDKTGFQGKVAIANELKQHKAILPSEINERLEGLTKIELGKRVKN